MEDTTSTIPLAKCPVCRKEVAQEDVFCNNCGYPRKGSEQEQRKFLLKRNTQKSQLESADKKLWQATNTLFIVGALIGVLALGNCFLSFTPLRGNYSQLISQLALSFTFIGLGFWCKKKPFPAILSGFSLYLLVQILYSITDPAFIFNWIVLKLFIIGFLANGIRAVLVAEKVKKEMNM